MLGHFEAGDRSRVGAWNLPACIPLDAWNLPACIPLDAWNLPACIPRIVVGRSVDCCANIAFVWFKEFHFSEAEGVRRSG